ncbi:MAG: hypothetical protein ACKVQT_21025 [Burkholderiales bacterium]
MATTKSASKRVRKSHAAPKKRPSVKRGRVAKKTLVARRRLPQRAKLRPARRSALLQPAITIQDNDEALAAREERHGMIEEAIEPPPSRDGHDIQRE